MQLAEFVILRFFHCGKYLRIQRNLRRKVAIVNLILFTLGDNKEKNCRKTFAFIVLSRPKSLFLTSLVNKFN